MPYHQIAQKILPHSTLIDSWPLSGGMSAEMTAVEVKTADGRIKRMIIRRYNDGRHDPYLEYTLLKFTHAQDLLTPEPLLYDNSGHILDNPYMVTSFIEGEMTFTPADMSSHMRQLAGQLAQIHSLDLAGSDLDFLPQAPNQCTELHGDLTCLFPFSAEAARIIERLRAATPEPSGNQTALLHGDFWPGNTLWQNGRLTAVIDWEDAGQGDPLIDFAKSRSEIAWIFGPGALDTFTRHYQDKMALDYANLPYWDLCAALRQLRLVDNDFAGLADFFVKYGRSDITAQSIKKDIRSFTTQALKQL